MKIGQILSHHTRTVGGNTEDFPDSPAPGGLKKASSSPALLQSQASRTVQFQDISVNPAKRFFGAMRKTVSFGGCLSCMRNPGANPLPAVTLTLSSEQLMVPRLKRYLKDLHRDDQNQMDNEVAEKVLENHARGITADSFWPLERHLSRELLDRYPQYENETKTKKGYGRPELTAEGNRLVRNSFYLYGSKIALAGEIDRSRTLVSQASKALSPDEQSDVGVPRRREQPRIKGWSSLDSVFSQRKDGLDPILEDKSNPAPAQLQSGPALAPEAHAHANLIHLETEIEDALTALEGWSRCFGSSGEELMGHLFMQDDIKLISEIKSLQTKLTALSSEISAHTSPFYDKLTNTEGHLRSVQSMPELRRESNSSLPKISEH